MAKNNKPENKNNKAIPNTSVDEISDALDEGFGKDTDIDDILNNTNKKATNKKLTVWLKPITKKQLIYKLIPFMIICLLAIAAFIVLMIVPTFCNLTGNAALGVYIFAPILLVCISPFAFYAFDRPYCQYNLKHNEKMKKFLGKVFVKQYTQNGCFQLRRIYIENPNTLAWNSLNGERIVAEYAKWDFESYSKDIKYYKEHQL